MKSYFITYGDNKFKFSKIHLIELAKQTGCFDEFISLGPENLDINFKNKYHEILEQPRGGGYWVWKHEIISNLMNRINNDDILLYCDAGSSINNLPIAQNRLKDYLSIIKEKNISFLRFETEKNFIEREYTSLEVFKALNIDLESEIALSTQLQAGVMFFKKNEESKQLLEDYTNILSEDPKLITDFYNTNQAPYFVENRHDQSLFSILGKKYNSFILENETEFRNRREEQFDYPILTVRASNHGIKDKIKLTLFKKIYGRKTKFF